MLDDIWLQECPKCGVKIVHRRLSNRGSDLYCENGHKTIIPPTNEQNRHEPEEPAESQEKRVNR